MKKINKTHVLEGETKKVSNLLLKSSKMLTKKNNCSKMLTKNKSNKKLTKIKLSKC